MSRFMATKYPYHPNEKKMTAHTKHTYSHMNIHMYAYTYIHRTHYIHTHIHTLTHEYTHTCIYINTPHTTFTHTYAHSYMNIHTCAYTYIHHTYPTSTHAYTRIHTLTHVQANIWYTSYPTLYLSHWLPQECSMRVTRLLCDHHYYVNCGVSLHSRVGTQWYKMWGHQK